jgi:hypothetical protein
MIEAHAARLRARIAAEPQLQAAMAKGRALAQRGELQRQALRHLAERRARARGGPAAATRAFADDSG